MAGESQTDSPDLKNGVPEGDLPDGGMLVGHVDDNPVLLARRGSELFAIGVTCTHYGGPPGEGSMVGDTVRCPWHHACFSLRTGETLVAPALTPTSCWRIEHRGGRLFVREKIPPTERRAPTRPRPTAGVQAGMVIIGGGAAGYAATEMLRREGYDGRITLVSADDNPPYDRPNLQGLPRRQRAGRPDPIAPGQFLRREGHRPAVGHDTLAVATIFRGLESLKAELDMERGRHFVRRERVLARHRTSSNQPPGLYGVGIYPSRCVSREQSRASAVRWGERGNRGRSAGWPSRW